MTKENDPFHDEEIDKTCPITNKQVIDDCHIKIEFGYGSDLDMTTYSFSPVHEKVGKKVLDYIKSLMPQGHSIDEFGNNMMDEYFDWDEWSEEDKRNHGLLD
jgi:hypothetical protein